MLQIDSPALRRLLLSGSFGLEKESLRVDEAGFLAHTPHPFPDNPTPGRFAKPFPVVLSARGWHWLSSGRRQGAERKYRLTVKSMCELFGVGAAVPIPVNGLLKEFFSHSTEHPNGWGMATFHGNAASLEKEPVPAFRSSYLKARLFHPLETDGMIAHIRLATVGSTDYENCHPFVQRDCFHRCWTLAHNGTMFHSPALAPYQYV